MVFPLLFYLFLAKSDQIVIVLTYNMAAINTNSPKCEFFYFLIVFPWLPSNSFKPQLIC